MPATVDTTATLAHVGPGAGLVWHTFGTFRTRTIVSCKLQMNVHLPLARAYECAARWHWHTRQAPRGRDEHHASTTAHQKAGRSGGAKAAPDTRMAGLRVRPAASRPHAGRLVGLSVSSRVSAGTRSTRRPGGQTAHPEHVPRLGPSGPGRRRRDDYRRVRRQRGHPRGVL
jgi:hypothetical protein